MGMEKIKCNIEVEVNKGLFYAISALSNKPIDDVTIDAIMSEKSYNLSLSDLGMQEEQKNSISLAVAAIILGKQLEKEEEKKGK